MDQGMTVGDLGSHQHPCRAAQLAGLKEEERGKVDLSLNTTRTDAHHSLCPAQANPRVHTQTSWQTHTRASGFCSFITHRPAKQQPALTGCGELRVERPSERLPKVQHIWQLFLWTYSG